LSLAFAKRQGNMKRQIVSACLFLPLLFSVGCYSSEVVTKDDVNSKAEQVDITVWTKRSLEYKFLKDNYRIHSDTLTGVGVQTTGGNDVSFHGSIPFSDIAMLRTDEFDVGATTLAIVIPIALLFGIFLYSIQGLY